MVFLQVFLIRCMFPRPPSSLVRFANITDGGATLLHAALSPRAVDRAHGPLCVGTRDSANFPKRRYLGFARSVEAFCMLV